MDGVWNGEGGCCGVDGMLDVGNSGDMELGMASQAGMGLSFSERSATVLWLWIPNNVSLATGDEKHH